MTKLQAWHNDPSLKVKMLQKAKEHREADEYLKGTYGKYEEGEFKACSVGCSVRDLDPQRGIRDLGDHEYLAEQLGVPLFITRIQDTIFEGLSEGDSTKWTERLFEAIPVGADLTTVMPNFLLSLMERNILNVDKEEEIEAYSAIEAVIRVLSDWVETGSVDQEAVKAAYYIANAAAKAAYGAKAATYATYAAYAVKAAYTAAYAAYADILANAANVVDYAAANYAANYAAHAIAAANHADIEYNWMADELISLIKDSN